jgi:tRNA(Ile)-lysidine synthase
MPTIQFIAAAQRAIDAFERACDALDPLGSGRRLLLACSAGGDSMTLLDLAARAAQRRDWELAVVHIDHGQRPQSAEEARFAAAEASRNNLTFFSECLDEELIQSSPLSEDVMRQARHDIFRRLSRQWEADAVALAHHGDDRAETFLIRLLAGSGPTGLSAIRPVERLGELMLVRPLLAARRADMRAYLKVRELEWHDDPSNADIATKRGWVRHTLLPQIRDHIGLDPTGRIVRASELIEEEAAVVAETSGLILRQLALPTPESSLARLDLEHPLWAEAGALSRRQILRQWLWDLRRRPYPPGYAAVAEALTFADQARPGAELRSIERIHIVHCKTSLVAFDPSVESEVRCSTIKPLLPPPKPRKKKKRA